MLTQIRIDKITIEVPSIGDEIWVHMELQEVQWNDEKTKVLNVVPRSNYVHKKATDIALLMVDLADPVTGLTGKISGAGIHSSLELLAMSCAQEKVGGVFDEEGILWQS